ncbi:MAG TPA: hypothetical protein VM120_27660 [Bryobacteraceae bacterium]|nr:hypothetical protein [Bryobacteraceae bacterium]
MRTSCLLAVLCLPLAGQQVTNYRTDINGRRVADGTTAAVTGGNTTTRMEVTQSINGRQIPKEIVEERVVSSDATGRVVERVVRRFDQNGNPAQAEKQRIEEKKNADGSVSSLATVYRQDINGRFELSERRRTEASKMGDTTTANVQVERPTLNGSLETVEKQVQVATDGKTAAKADVTTYRKDQTGRFVESWRSVTDSADQNGQRVENQAEYEPGENGRLRLAGQTVSRIRKNTDGTESREVDIFRNVPGRAETVAAPALRERQVIEQRKVGDQLIETTLVQRPTISDPNHLGAPVKIGERICTGAKCK